MLVVNCRTQRPGCTRTVDTLLDELRSHEKINSSNFTGARNSWTLTKLQNQGFIQESEDPGVFVPGPIWIELQIIANQLSTNKFFYKKGKPHNLYLRWENSDLASFTVYCIELKEIESDLKKRRSRFEIRKLREKREVVFSAADLKNWKSSGFLDEVKNVIKGHPDPAFARLLKNRCLTQPELIGFLQDDVSELANWIDCKTLEGLESVKKGE
jgi:hypothetical protein